MQITRRALGLLLGAACSPFLRAQDNSFWSLTYRPAPLPTFEITRGKLPSPIYDQAPVYVEMYWKAWELAFRNFHEPAPGSGFVSQFIDASFNQNIFLWDTCFMTMFTNYAHPLVPGIGSLDNFYAKQHEDGEICREIDRSTGRDLSAWVNESGKDLFSRHGTDWGAKGFAVSYIGREVPKPAPILTLDALSHPIAAWAELESLHLTGDMERLKRVYGPLVKYHRALKKYLLQGNGLYLSDWSSMDNSPRNDDLVGGGTAVDTSAEMVMFADQLAQIADLLGKKDEAAGYRSEARSLAQTINQKMWDPQRRFYFDLRVDGQRSRVKTVAAFWTLLAGVATPEQAHALAAELQNPKTFGRKHRVPTLSADEPGFNPNGGYWRGSVWAPTTTMVIRGLQRYRKDELAHAIADEHLRVISEVYGKTHTLWENYAPDTPRQGDPAKADFVGWSGIGPIAYFIEFAIGIKADALEDHIDWNISSPTRVGLERFRFGGKTVDLVCEAADGTGKRKLKVQSDSPLSLVVHWQGKQHRYDIAAGKALSATL